MPSPGANVPLPDSAGREAEDAARSVERALRGLAEAGAVASAAELTAVVGAALREILPVHRFLLGTWEASTPSPDPLRPRVALGDAALLGLSGARRLIERAGRAGRPARCAVPSTDEAAPSGQAPTSAATLVAVVVDVSGVGRAALLVETETGVADPEVDAALEVVAAHAAIGLDRLRMAERIVACRRRERLVAEARAALGAAADPDPALAEVVAATSEALALRCLAARLEGDRLVPVVQPADGDEGTAALAELVGALPAVVVQALVAAHRRAEVPLVLHDVATLRADLSLPSSGAASEAETLSLFPLVAGGDLLGAVVVLEPAAESRAAQDPEVRETIAEVAAELGHALDHARQIAREARQRRRAEVLAGTLGALLREEDVDDILQATARAVIEVVEADAAAIYLYDEELPVESRAYLVGHDAVIRPHLISAAAYAPSQVPAERRMVETRRAQFLGPGDPWAMTLPDLRERYPYRLLVPVMTANQVLGALYLYRSRPQPFEPADAEAAGELAAEAAVVLEQRRLQRAERRQREILVKVHTLARRLNRASSEQTIAQIAVEECAAAFDTRRASLHLYEPNADRLTIAASIGLPQGYITGTAYVAPGSCASGMAAERRGLVVIDDMRVHPDWERWRPYTDPYPELRAVWSLPLVAENEELLGAISLYFDRPRPASENDQTLFGLIAHQVAVALERALLADRTRELYRASVASLAAAVDAKDPFTHNHSWQVAAYSRRIAQAMGLSPADVEIVELAGLLHDVGKIGIPDRILQKADRLDPDEWAMMRRHPDLGARIIGDSPALASLVPMVRHHHERYDGHGYPDGLSGEAIPLGAAIVGLADAFDTMISDRPYRRASTIDEAIAEIERCSGTHFMPRVVEAFLAAVTTGEIGSTTSSLRGTRSLQPPRLVSAEARAFGLLQRISGEVSSLVQIERFLARLSALIQEEFPDALCDIFVREVETGDLIGLVSESQPLVDRAVAPVLRAGQGIVGWVAMHGVSQNIADVSKDSRYVPSSAPGVRSELAVPLLSEGRCIGVVNLESRSPAAFSATDQQVLELVASYVAQAIEVADLHEQVKRQASRDPMTGLLNHRAFYDRLEKEVERAREAGGTLAVAILDVDGLKAVNDSEGHLAGDDAIRRLAKILAEGVRPGDAVARYGGDEFAIIVPDISKATMAARLRAIDEAIAEEHARRPLPAVSWGIACYPEDGSRATELVARADAAMYAVKIARATRRPRR